jgi:hypothetical protein
MYGVFTMDNRKKIQALKSLLGRAQEAKKWGMVLYYQVLIEELSAGS